MFRLAGMTAAEQATQRNAPIRKSHADRLYRKRLGQPPFGTDSSSAICRRTMPAAICLRSAS